MNFALHHLKNDVELAMIDLFNKGNVDREHAPAVVLGKIADGHSPGLVNGRATAG